MVFKQLGLSVICMFINLLVLQSEEQCLQFLTNILQEICPSGLGGPLSPRIFNEAKENENGISWVWVIMGFGGGYD